MRFETEFPELKEKYCCSCAKGYKHEFNCEDGAEDTIRTEDVKKHCLSRSRVKQVIDKIQLLGCTCQGGECDSCYSNRLLNILKKELGLENE